MFKKEKNKLIVYLMILGIILGLPSILYLIKNRMVVGAVSENYYFIGNQSFISSIIGALIFATILILMFIIYLKIIKRSNEFQSIKNILVSTLLVGIIFSICLPNTSSDLFYYMGTGRAVSQYYANPYYVSIDNVLDNYPNDKILSSSGVWKDTTVVYGPIWVTITAVLNMMSFGSANVLLYLFKIASLIMYLLTTVIIYKLTQKKKFACIFAFNPLVILEFLVNCHNDIYMIFFALIGIWYIRESQNIKTNWKKVLYLLCGILMLAISVAIKYIMILIFPFLILYYFRQKSTIKKVLFCFLCTIVFGVLTLLLYLPWFNSVTDALNGIFAQQSKIKDSIYLTISILTQNSSTVISYVYSFIVFIAFYIFIVKILMQLLRKNNFKIAMKNSYIILMILIFGVLTNLTSWYLSWLFIPFYWLNAKDMKNIIWLQFGYEFTYVVFLFAHANMYYYEAFVLPMIVAIMLIRFVVLKKIGDKNEKERRI